MSGRKPAISAEEMKNRTVTSEIGKKKREETCQIVANVYIDALENLIKQKNNKKTRIPKEEAFVTYDKNWNDSAYGNEYFEMNENMDRIGKIIWDFYAQSNYATELKHRAEHGLIITSVIVSWKHLLGDD